MSLKKTILNFADFLTSFYLFFSATIVIDIRFASLFRLTVTQAKQLSALFVSLQETS